MKIIKSSAISGEVSVSDVIAELRRGSRVLLLLRHSERPRIGYEDKTFGASLPLTENTSTYTENPSVSNSTALPLRV